MNAFGLPERHYGSVNAYLLDLAKDVLEEPDAVTRLL